MGGSETAPDRFITALPRRRPDRRQSQTIAGDGATAGGHHSTPVTAR